VCRGTGEAPGGFRQEEFFMSHLFTTQNNIPSNSKKAVIDMLNKALAATIDLALIVKQAHWNVKGSRFIAVHEMLDGFRDGLDEHADEIAERVAQLGGTACGTSQAVAEATVLKPYPIDIYTVEDHIHALIGAYGAAANLVRKYVDETAEAGDADAADILTAASRTLDKNLWFLEAHIQGKESRS